MSKEIKYIVFKDKKGNVVSTAQESVARDHSSELTIEVSEPPGTTKEQVDKSTFEKHQADLTSSGQ